MALRIRVCSLSPPFLETELNHANDGERESSLKKGPLEREAGDKVDIRESC